eukprot:3152362-Alexandrium_andersonii.AAC.1
MRWKRPRGKRREARAGSKQVQAGMRATPDYGEPGTLHTCHAGSQTALPHRSGRQQGQGAGMWPTGRAVAGQGPRKCSHARPFADRPRIAGVCRTKGGACPRDCYPWSWHAHPRKPESAPPAGCRPGASGHPTHHDDAGWLNSPSHIRWHACADDPSKPLLPPGSIPPEASHSLRHHLLSRACMTAAKTAGGGTATRL